MAKMRNPQDFDDQSDDYRSRETDDGGRARGPGPRPRSRRDETEYDDAADEATEDHPRRPDARPPRLPSYRQTAMETPPPTRGGRPRLPFYQRRGFQWTIGFVAALLLIIWALPVIIAKTPLINSLVGIGARDLDGSLRIGSASLGWFSPIACSDLEIRDPQNKVVLSVPQVRGDRALASILWNGRYLGKFRFEKPQITVSFDERTSNLEELLAKILARKGRPQRYDMAIEVVDGTVLVEDRGRNASCKIDNLQLKLASPLDPQGTLELDAAGAVQQPGAAAGELKAALEIGPLADDDSDQSVAHRKATGGVALPKTGRVSLGLRDLPLGVWQSLASRFAKIDTLDGRVTGMLQIHWNGPASEKSKLDANLNIDDLLLGGRALGPDLIKLKEARAVCSIGWPAQEVRVRELKLECELGTANLVGTFHPGRFTARGALESLHGQTYEIAADVDLARLAQALPNTLHIQKNTQIVSGRLQASFNSKPGPDGAVAQGKLEASPIKAVRDGREVQWDQPVVLTFAARESAQGPVIDKIDCRSSFLQMEGSGTSEKLTATAHCDLDQLSGQLGQFVDLGSVRLTGQAWSRFQWQQGQRSAFSTDGELQVRDMSVILGQRTLMQKSNFNANLALSGAMDGPNLQSVKTATLSMETRDDKLEAQLDGPLNDLRDGGRWPIDVRLTGNLNPWINRLRPWVDLSSWQIAGKGDLAGRLTWDRDAIALQGVKFTATPLQLAGPGLSINESGAEIVATGRWTRASGRVELEQATLNSGTLAARVSDFVLAWPAPDRMECKGLLQYQANLARLQQWLTTTANAANWQMSGDLIGQGRIAQSEGLVRTTLDSTINNFGFGSRDGKRFTEPQVRLVARTDYDPAKQILKLSQVDLASGMVAGSLGGQIAFGARSNVDVTGKLNYDLEKLTELARPYHNGKVQLTGSGSSPITIRGPLDLAQLQVDTAVQWKSGDVYGFLVGPGQLRGRLAGGVVKFDPLAVDVSEGRVEMTPTLRLSPGPAELTVAPGVVARQIRANPAMCEQALKYLAPALSGLSEVEGRFSVQLDTCRIPLDKPESGDLSGKFTVHSIQINAGPLVRELATLFGHPGNTRLAQESVIAFQMRQGRVYHDNMQLVFPEATVTTSGSVGMDQSMSLNAQMPIPTKLLDNTPLANTPLANSLRNESINVPIGGTMDKPQLDMRAVQEANRKVLQKAARGILGDEQLGRQLEQLLMPPR